MSTSNLLASSNAKLHVEWVQLPPSIHPSIHPTQPMFKNGSQIKMLVNVKMNFVLTEEERFNVKLLKAVKDEVETMQAANANSMTE